jgi:acetyl esterase/lipase
MSAVLLLLVGLVSFAGAANGRWPLQGRRTLIASWFGAFIVVELSVHLSVIGGLLIAALAIFGDGLGSALGWVGLALWAAAVLLALPFGLSSMRTRLDVDGRPDDFEAGPLGDLGPKLPWWLYVVPVAMWWRPGVKHERGVVYGEVDGHKLKLDIARPKADPGRKLPAVINVHGGVWMFGSRYEQGQPLINHLAANGWVGFNIDYRLSPKATLPDHINDVKRAIAWVREHADELGVDADFIALTGGSAGGHLTALAALTADDPTLQPGFEQADTSVQVAVPFYGAYDLVDEKKKVNANLRNMVERHVMKAKIEDEPERFIAMSPIRRLRPDAPPFFVIHGNGDTVVPVGGSRHFVAELRGVSQQPVLYAEMPGGQHAFDSVPTRRSGPVIRAIERFLAAAYATRHESAAATERAAEEALTP